MSKVSDSEVDSYLETALWAETDENQNPLDDTYGIYDFTPAARRQAEVEMQAFWDEAQRVVEVLERHGEGLPDEALADLNWPHDFWLTRNGHGAGFWDRPERYGEAADPLTEIAQRFGERHVLETGNGEVEFFPPLRTGPRR